MSEARSGGVVDPVPPVRTEPGNVDSNHVQEVRDGFDEEGDPGEAEEEEEEFDDLEDFDEEEEDDLHSDEDDEEEEEDVVYHDTPPGPPVYNLPSLAISNADAKRLVRACPALADLEPGGPGVISRTWQQLAAVATQLPDIKWLGDHPYAYANFARAGDRRDNGLVRATDLSQAGHRRYMLEKFCRFGGAGWIWFDGWFRWCHRESGSGRGAVGAEGRRRVLLASPRPRSGGVRITAWKRYSGSAIRIGRVSGPNCVGICPPTSVFSMRCVRVDGRISRNAPVRRKRMRCVNRGWVSS